MSDVLGMGGPEIGDGERRAVDRVLRSGRLAQGPEVEAFERELATDLAGTRHAVAVASGTAALDLALAAIGIGEDDEVLTTPFTYSWPVVRAAAAMTWSVAATELITICSGRYPTARPVPRARTVGVPAVVRRIQVSAPDAL